MNLLSSTQHLSIQAALLVATFCGLLGSSEAAVYPGPTGKSGSIPSMDARSRPDGFGTDGVQGPVIQLRGMSGRLGLTASGSWCRNGSGDCSGPDGDTLDSPGGPLPGEAYNRLGGEWIGGASDGKRFAIGAGADLRIPSGANAVQLFFNDDLGSYDDNLGTVSVLWTIEVLDGRGPRPVRNPDGEWGVPENTLTIPAPNPGQGLYLIDIQDSYPNVDWDTLDRLYLEGGEYKFLRLGNLPERSPDRPLVITNINGQVRVGGQGHYYLLVLSGGANWILTGKFDPISRTGDPQYPGHKGNDYTDTRGRYGILVDDDFHNFGSGNSGITVGSKVPDGIVNPPTSDFEISFIEIREVGFAGMSIKTDNDGTLPMNNVHIHDNYIHDVGSEGLYIGSTQAQPQHSFNNLHIDNNRILRTGTEALQIGQLGDGCEVNNNVFALSAIDWKDAFQPWQDSCSQVAVRYGKSSIHHNIFIGSANSLISFFGQDVGDPHAPGDGMSFSDNFYSSFRFLGGFLGGDADGISTWTVERNAFRQFEFQRDEIYSGVAHPGHLIRVNSAQTNPVELHDNVFDEPSLELVNGLGGALNGTVGNITATGNSREPVDPVTFRDFMGLPADVDYLLIERWAATSGLDGDAPTLYHEGDFVMHRANLYLCIEPGTHSGKDPLNHPSTWQLLPVPGDDVRLTPWSAHAGVGLEDR